MTKVVVFGLGSGGLDNLSVGVLRQLRAHQSNGYGLLLRTSIHPVVSQLEQEEDIRFSGSFDELYEAAEQFEDVYQAIADQLVSAAQEQGCIGYVVPGHPLLGEKAVALLLARSSKVHVEIVSSGSFIDAVLTAVSRECTELSIVDALSVPDVTDAYRAFASSFDYRRPNIVYQLHDRLVAGRVKLALLEQFPPEFEVVLVQAAGVAGREQVTPIPLSKLDYSANHFDHLTSLFIPVLTAPEPAGEFITLLDIMARLRDPQSGCPWDQEQTPQTLKTYVVEEAYEVLDAIDDGDPAKYAEELGDLLLQIAFHAQLARESGEFDIRDVIMAISEKMIRRHPHVFGDTTAADAQEVLRNWELIKRGEPGYEDRISVLDGVPRHLPALMKAYEVSKRAVKAGFEWPTIDGVFDKLDEELTELHAAMIEGDQESIESEIGDILFTIVNLARYLKVDAEESLRMMVARFSRRFRFIERQSPKLLDLLTLDEWDTLWQAAKMAEMSA